MGNETNRIFTGLGPKQILKVNSGVHLTVVSAFPALGKCKYYVGSIKKQYYVCPFKVCFCLFKQACGLLFLASFPLWGRYYPFSSF